MTEQTTPNQSDFADALIAIGRHIKNHPHLPSLYGVMDLTFGTEIVLGTGDPAKLTAWAATLSHVSSFVQRMRSGSVHGIVSGRIGDLSVKVLAYAFPKDAFPDEVGVHEWDVTALLQEA